MPVWTTRREPAGDGDALVELSVDGVRLPILFGNERWELAKIGAEKLVSRCESIKEFQDAADMLVPSDTSEMLITGAVEAIFF